MLLYGVPQAFPIRLRCLWLPVLRVLTQCSCSGLLWWGELRKVRPPRGSLGSWLCSSPLQFSFRMVAASMWSWMRFLSFYLGAIAAARRRFCICLFRAFPMQVVTTTPQTSKRLLAVGPDTAKILAVVALRKTSLSCEFFKIIHKYSVCTSQETQYVSATEINWLMLFRGKNSFFDFIHFCSVTLVNTIKITSFIPPSVIKLYLLFAHAFTCFGFLVNHLQKAHQLFKGNYHYMIHSYIK
jgi:hypothetical protein